MKIKIEIDEALIEDEVVIRCQSLTEQIGSIQRAISAIISTKERFCF